MVSIFENEITTWCLDFILLECNTQLLFALLGAVPSFLSAVVVVVPPILGTLQGCNEVLKKTATVENIIVNVNINWYTLT